MEEETTEFSVIEELNELITTLELEITETNVELASERNLLGVQFYFKSYEFKMIMKSD